MKISLDLSLAGLASSGGGVSFTPASWLADKKGFWIDPADTSRMWQDSAGTIPATGAADPVGLIHAQGPLTPVKLDQTISASRPSRSSSRFYFDGVDDFFDGDINVRAILNNAPGVAFLWRGRMTPPDHTAMLGFSAEVGLAQVRFIARVTSSGAMWVNYRRLDTDGEISVSSATNRVPFNTDCTLEYYLNYATGGAGALEMIVNGVTVHTAAVAGSGNTSATTPGRMRLGRNLSQNPPYFFAGTMGRMVVANTVPNGADRVNLRTWINGGT
jgi:hypothetical protein